MRFLVVGLGSMGRRRIRALTRLGAGEIIGYDVLARRRDQVAESEGIHAYSDIAAAMDGAPDALVISTPPDRHAPYARLAAENGRHFFAEHATTDQGMGEAVALAGERNVVAAPSCTMRFHPSVRAMKELLDRRAIGEVLSFSHHCGQYLPDWHPWEDYREFYVSRRQTGACREMVPFELCWLTWLVGEVASVAAMKGKVSRFEADIDDVYQLVLRTQDGAIGHLQVDVVARPAVRHCRILGTEGTLEWSMSDKAVRHYDARTGEWERHPEPEARVADGYSGISVEDMYLDEMRAFLAAVRGEAAFPYSFEEDARALNILRAAERSAEQGRRIDID